MSARALVFIVIALVMAGATAMIARNYLSSERAELSAQATPVPQQVTKNVLVATVELPAGSFVKPEHVRWQSWPETALNDSYLIEGIAKPEDVVGSVVRRGIVSLDLAQVAAAVGLPEDSFAEGITRQSAEAVANAARALTGSSHALAVLTDLDEGTDRIDFGASVCLAIATASEVVSRRSRIVGGRDWVRLGAVELGLDCLRRYLQGLPVDERIDFEKVEVPANPPARAGGA